MPKIAIWVIFVPLGVLKLHTTFFLGGETLSLKNSSREEQAKFLRACGPTCSPRQLAHVLGGQPYYYNMAAKNGTLEFDSFWRGRNLRIYTEDVIKKITGG